MRINSRRLALSEFKHRVGRCWSPGCVWHSLNDSVTYFLRPSTIGYRNIVTHTDQTDNFAHATGVTVSKQLIPSTAPKPSAGQVNASTRTWTGSRAEISPQRGATERSIGLIENFPASDMSKTSCVFPLVFVLFEAPSIWGHTNTRTRGGL